MEEWLIEWKWFIALGSSLRRWSYIERGNKYIGKGSETAGHNHSYTEIAWEKKPRGIQECAPLWFIKRKRKRKK